jgi:hypothetical protein
MSLLVVGLPTIRSARVENTLIQEFDRHQDLYTSASYVYLCWFRALGYIVEICFVIFTTGIIIILLFNDDGINFSIYFVTLGFSPNIPLQESLVAYKIPSFASAKTSARATPSRIFHLIRRIFTHFFSLLNLPCHVPLRTVSFE